MDSSEPHATVPIASRADGIGTALRILCPACHTALPDDILMLLRMLDAVPDRVSDPDSARQPRP